MIYGVGTDIVSVARMGEALARHGERFAERILAPDEREDWRVAPHAARFLAKRFGMKEAFSKALGTGIRPPATFHGVFLEHDQIGKPLLRYSCELARLMADLKLSAHVSISDEADYAVAFVVIEKAPDTC